MVLASTVAVARSRIPVPSSGEKQIIDGLWMRHHFIAPLRHFHYAHVCFSGRETRTLRAKKVLSAFFPSFEENIFHGKNEFVSAVDARASVCALLPSLEKSFSVRVYLLHINFLPQHTCGAAVGT